MKKIVSLLVILMLSVISICACNSNTDDEILNNNDKSNDVSTNVKESQNINLEIKSGESLIEEIANVKIENNDEIDSTQSISVAATSLSNKKHAWGFVRKKDEVRPEFSKAYIDVLEDYEGIYAGNSEQKVIYLTFDEGYENGYTASILDTLKEKNCPATFFVTKPYVKQNQELVKRMIDEGHIVGNHTVNHPSMPEVTDDSKLKSEITGLHDYVKDLFDFDMEFLRPPKGEYSERTVAISKDLGYRTVLWSSAYDDWDVKKQGRLEYARGMILNYVHNGCVMLLHAVSKDNTELLGEVIDEIRNRGYEIKPLSEFEY